MAAAPDAVSVIIAACAGLPLALAIAAAYPELGLGGLTALLTDPSTVRGVTPLN